MVFKNVCRVFYNVLREEWGLKVFFDYGFVKDLSFQRVVYIWFSFFVVGFILYVLCKVVVVDCIVVV